MDEWLEKIREAGIIGAGGAGFPSYVKYNAKPSVLIANGAECEPLLGTDQAVMKKHPKEVVTALKAVGEKLGVQETYIAIKRKHADCIEKIQKAIDEISPDLKIFYLDDFYPAGDEVILVHEVTGKTVPPAGIPINVGVCVSNVGTLYNVYNALFNDSPVTEKVVTINGEVKDPKVINVPVGTSIGECIKAAGGALIDDYALIIGGPMMGKLHVNGKEALDLPVTRTTGGILVLPKDHTVVLKKGLSPEMALKRARVSCIQCRYCTDMCPRHLLGHKLSPHLVMRTVSNIQSGVDITMAALCSECNVCEMYACPMGITPRSVNSLFKSKLRQKGIRYNYDGYEMECNSQREFRKVPFGRLVMRLGLGQYKGELEYEDALREVSTVKILTKDGAGKNAKPVVNAGDEVKKGQKIAEIESNALGVPAYASIDGVVKEVCDDYIVINKQGVIQ